MTLEMSAEQNSGGKKKKTEERTPFRLLLTVESKGEAQQGLWERDENHRTFLIFSK